MNIPMKTLLRSTFPKTYMALGKVKDYILYNPADQWNKYFTGAAANGQPDTFLASLEVPPYIDTVMDIGCGAGRNLIPFDGKFNLWGVDLVPFKRIKWLRAFKNLTYTQSTLQKLTYNLPDMRKVLVFSCGTMMYLSEKEQMAFFEACRQRGCRAFAFVEYSHDYFPGGDGKDFKLPVDIFKQQPAPYEHTAYTSIDEFAAPTM